jgi:hypothetical protein
VADGGSTWIKSHADLAGAIADGLLGAAANGAGGIELWVAAVPGRVLDLPFYESAGLLLEAADQTEDQTGDTPGATPAAFLSDAVDTYMAAGRAVIAADGEGGISAPDGGAVLIGLDDGFNRLREGSGDDVMYGGTGPDQFVWAVGRGGAERDTILDLDFAEGDVLRVADGGSTWIKSHADLAGAIADGLLGAAANGTGGIDLWAVAAPDRVLELPFYDHFDFV